MKIIDKLTGRLFDIPSDFKISFEKSNPFLSAQGTISLPIVFPYTDTNVQILDNPVRYDRAVRLKIKRKVIIQAGPYQREATLAFTGGKRPTAFSSGYLNGTFLLDEAVFYNQMKDVTMQSVFSSIVRDDFTGTREAKIAAWVDYLQLVMTGQAVDDFHIFPVCYETTNPETVNGFLNHVTSLHESTFWVDIDAYEVSYFNLSGKYPRTYVIDEADVAIPIGYEITPFLRLSYVLNTLFSKYGYVLNPDYLVKYPDMLKEVVLNNTADSLMLGFLNYGHLVPTKTINEYLNSVRIKYGCEFFLADNGVDVNLVFWNDVLTEPADLDLSKVIQDSPLCNCEDPRTVQLTGSYTNNIIPSKFKSFSEILKTFGNIPVTTGSLPPNYIVGDPAYFEQIFFDQRYLQYFHIWDKNNNPAVHPTSDMLGENLFDYYAADNVTAMPFANPWEAVPMIPVHLSKTKDKTPIWEPTLEFYWVPNIPYIGPVCTPNSSILINATNKDNSQVKTNSQVECPIMSCFHVGKRQRNLGSLDTANSKIYYGSTYRFDDAGIPWGSFNLVNNGPNGLFETFWKKFDAVLRNSWQPMIFPVNLSIYQALHWDPSKQKMLNGQPLVSEVLKYELSDAGITVTEADFRTTKLYQ